MRYGQPHARTALGYTAHYLLLAGLFLSLPHIAGCILANKTSSVPIYPATWAPRVPGPVLPADLVGDYSAVSEPVGPLVYPPGGDPRVVFLFIPISKLDPPTLGRRVLMWHLAPPEPFESLRNQAIASFAANAEGSPQHATVRISSDSSNELRIRGYLGSSLQCEFRLPAAPSQSPLAALWHTPAGYLLQDGGVTLHTGFPLPKVEQSPGAKENVAGGWFTFYRATDGSLVMLEVLTWSYGSDICFARWWRFAPRNARDIP